MHSVLTIQWNMVGFILAQAKKYIAPVTVDFDSSTPNDKGSRKNFKESVSENIMSGKRSLGEGLKSRWSGKGFKRTRSTSSLIILHSDQKQKHHSWQTKKKETKSKNCQIEKDFFSWKWDIYHIKSIIPQSPHHWIFSMQKMLRWV